ncbi:hypothetical protein BDQ12DRAFT_732139 [Crucibulum laeve]|uniref:DUF6699 domain-containing protein n=1 Tax=Crucibulum laeve TaxID=68775 RepID=A0A5C3MMW2_9AGAR|nr:hypothetical protein BDQ12DRAFT_732139 [Crucibulum laeve]
MPRYHYNSTPGATYAPLVRSPPCPYLTPQPWIATPLAPLGAALPPIHITTPVSAGPLALPFTSGNVPAWPWYQHTIVPTPAAIASHVLPPVWTPGTFPVAPPDYPVPFQLHPHIIYNPNNPGIPILQWDVIHKAELARVFNGRHLIVPLKLDAEAVVPSIKKIWIASDHPILAWWMEVAWGPIVIEKDKITIRDVLDAIHEYFQQPLTTRDLVHIKASCSEEALQHTARRRIRESYELRAVNTSAGVKRIDALGTHRRFQGLRPVVFQDNTWKLFLGLLPGPVPRVY